MRRTVRVTAAAALAAWFCGCAWLGPEIIRSGRPAYNDAILTTNDEQLLQNIVRMRFGDSVGFLTVSSVTANVSLISTGSVDIGLGPSANYAGNLVPFKGTVTAEQNPTISYTPVGGDRVLRQLASETPIDLTILLINTAHTYKDAWSALIRRVNNVLNPDFVDPPAVEIDPRFEEIVALASRLQQRGSLYWARLADVPSGYALVLHSYSPASAREAARLLDLLGIAKPAREGADVVVPIQLSVGSPEPGTLGLETRSLFTLMKLAAARIELPEEAAVGSVRFPQPGLAGRGIRILSSDVQPAQARVAVQYRGRWYYIEQTDESSKQWFAMMQLLANAQVPDSGATRPVLTIPVTGRR